MTGSKILLDTNIVIEIFKGNRTIADKLHKLPGFFLPAIVLGELYIGINRVANRTKHLKELNSFLQLCTVLPVDKTTAKKYGELIAALYKKGKPLPTNDVWIAATAIQHKLTLITRDDHFEEIDKLKTKYW
jgi:tRNA(fMet)-specific endonuclease VapC